LPYKKTLIQYCDSVVGRLDFDPGVILRLVANENECLLAIE
jgi:hypothetical protein